MSPPFNVRRIRTNFAISEQSNCPTGVSPRHRMEQSRTASSGTDKQSNSRCSLLCSSNVSNTVPSHARVRRILINLVVRILFSVNLS